MVDVQRCRGAEVQRGRGAEGQRGGGAEVQRGKGAEVQRGGGAGGQRGRGGEVRWQRALEHAPPVPIACCKRTPSTPTHPSCPHTIRLPSPHTHAHTQTTTPRHTTPHHTTLHHTSPHHTTPHHTSPHLTSPHLNSPHHTTQHHTTTTPYTAHLIRSHPIPSHCCSGQKLSAMLYSPVQEGLSLEMRSYQESFSFQARPPCPLPTCHPAYLLTATSMWPLTYRTYLHTKLPI